MTVIAYRDGVMAADGRVVSGSRGAITSDNDVKVFKLPDGSLFGGAGDAARIEELRACLSQGAAPGRIKGVEAIHVKPDGKIWIYEQGGFFHCLDKYAAGGSGFTQAYVAFDYGATAVEAVKAAIKRNINCGGRIRKVTLDAVH